MVNVQVKGTIVQDEDKEIYEWFGIDATCPSDIRQALASAKADEAITVEVNSGGGDVFAGNEIYYLLQSHKGEVTVDITGFAASAATVICCGADKVRAVPSALYMIHDVSSGARGNYQALSHEAQVLREADRAISHVYQLKTGLSEQELLELMDKESWMNATTAKMKGFIDEVIGAGDRLYNSGFAQILTPEVIASKKQELKNKQADDSKKAIDANKNKLKLLAMKGRCKHV